MEKEDRHTTLEQSLGVSHTSVKRIKVIKSVCMEKESAACQAFARFRRSVGFLAQHGCHISAV